MEAPALLTPLDAAAAALRTRTETAAAAAGLLRPGEALPGALRLETRREDADFADSCAFPLAGAQGLSPQAAAERLAALLGEDARAENGYLNFTLSDETFRQTLEALCTLPMPEPSPQPYPLTEEERLRRDRGCALYAVTGLWERLAVLTDRYAAPQTAAAPLSGEERRLAKELCRVSALLSEREGGALLRLLAVSAAALRRYLDTGPLLHGEPASMAGRLLLLSAAERVLYRGLHRLNLPYSYTYL